MSDDTKLEDILKQLDWAPDQQARSLRLVYEYSMDKAQDSINWYYNSARSKKRVAQRLRIVAIFFGALGTIFPVLATVLNIDPAWATVVLSVAATAIGLDTFFGFSSSWIRFITTAMKIESRLVAFRFEWQQETVLLEGENPPITLVQELVGKCATFVNEVQSMVKEETDLWVQEFRASLATLSEQVDAQRAALSTGAIEIYVENGTQSDNGWQVSVDDRRPIRYEGSKAVINHLVPGMYKISIKGSINGSQRSTETVIPVASGEIAKVNLSLE